MDAVQLLLFVISISIFAIAAMLIYEIRKNFLIGKSFRHSYHEKITQLRFGKKLAVQGIDIDELLHQQPIVEIENKLRACHSCLKTTQCDFTLNKHVVSKSDFSFCPN